MAEKNNDLWLKVLIGFIFSLLLLIATMGAKGLDKKVDKDVFDKCEKYQNKQYTDIKDSLKRIENKLP